MRSNVMAAVAAVLVTGFVLAPEALAQDKPKVIKPSDIPESAFPPVGMCRIWLADVAERQQPAPTDCSTAIRTMPRDATVLFGDLKRGAKLVNPVGLRGSSAADDAGARARGFTARQNEPRVGEQMRGSMTPTQAAAAASAATARTAPGAGATAVKLAPETKAAVVKPPEPPPQH